MFKIRFHLRHGWKPPTHACADTGKYLPCTRLPEKRMSHDHRALMCVYTPSVSVPHVRPLIIRSMKERLAHCCLHWSDLNKSRTLVSNL